MGDGFCIREVTGDGPLRRAGTTEGSCCGCVESGLRRRVESVGGGRLLLRNPLITSTKEADVMFLLGPLFELKYSMNIRLLEGLI